MLLSRGAAIATAVAVLAGGPLGAPTAAGAAPAAPSVVAPSAVLARTVVTGWPLSLGSASPGARLTVGVRVTSPSGPVARTVVLQRYLPASRTWVPVLKVRTGSAGRAVLRWSAPTTVGTVSYRLRVAPTSREAGLTTASARSRVVAPVTDPVLTEMLRAVNAARATARTCGATRYAAAPAVTAHATLTRVAESYAERLGREAFFSHTSPSGDGPGDRLSAAGYPWRTYGENIAAGYQSVSSAMAGWLDSPGHCANIMNPAFTEIGPGHASVSGSPYGTYWVLVLARR